MDPIELLKKDFLERSKSDPSIKKYVEGRLDSENRYTGWVGPTKTTKKPTLMLDLSKDNDRFLLYCLASAWSATGPWENAATLIYTIKNHCYDFSSPVSWCNDLKYQQSVIETTRHFVEQKDIFAPRKSASIRKDIFPAFRRIALHWELITAMMEDANEASDWEGFVHKLRDIRGLAPGDIGNKRLLIKIPLILRELRCQGFYQSIPGDLCCIPDARVINAIKIFEMDSKYDKSCGLKSYRPANAKSLIESSRAIYRLFGDLYDIPLFAAEDLYPSFSKS